MFGNTFSRRVHLRVHGLNGQQHCQSGRRGPGREAFSGVHEGPAGAQLAAFGWGQRSRLLRAAEARPGPSVPSPRPSEQHVPPGQISNLAPCGQNDLPSITFGDGGQSNAIRPAESEPPAPRASAETARQAGETPSVPTCKGRIAGHVPALGACACPQQGHRALPGHSGHVAGGLPVNEVPACLGAASASTRNCKMRKSRRHQPLTGDAGSASASCLQGLRVPSPGGGRRLACRRPRPGATVLRGCDLSSPPDVPELARCSHNPVYRGGR